MICKARERQEGDTEAKRYEESRQREKQRERERSTDGGRGRGRKKVELHKTLSAQGAACQRVSGGVFGGLEPV